MAYNFPNSPSNGDTVTISNVTYTYNSTAGAWKTTAAGGGGASVTSSDTAPSSPSAGDLWYDTTTLRLYVYYNDGSSSQWVKANPSGSSGALVQESAPSNPGSGNLWFDPSTLETYVYYNDGDSNQWVQTNPGGSASGITVYSSIDDLPLSGASTGDQAYVEGNNRLYIWNGTGWYNIALINTTPSISGASSAYTLATDGTATTVTITATDPEGLPITYSIASDTSGNIATVTQGTGSNTNVFTITPSTNTANAGTFSLTFRASDGVNIATAVSEFTLVFSIANSNYTTALITSVGANNAVNNSFDDASTNNHTITASGNVTQNTFSPYRHGGYSTYFDGSGDYLSVATNSVFSLDADFTIEFWVRISASTLGAIMSDGSASFTGNATALIFDHASYVNKISLWARNVATEAAILETNALSLDQWYHIAIVRDGSTITVYQDGSSVDTYTTSATISFAASGTKVGAYWNGSLNGYISDLRIVKGTAITPSSGGPTERLTAVTNTSLLTCHLPYIADGSTNAHSITVNGNTKTEPFSPYDHSGYSTADNGGSAYFDGTGDYLKVASSSTFNLYNTAFTIDGWFYATAPAGNEHIWASYIDVNNRESLYFTNATTLNWYVNGSARISATIAANNWYHFAIVDNNGTTTFYLNGVSQGTWTSTYTDGNRLVWLGTYNDAGLASDSFTGYLSDIRCVKGTAVYTSNFTPPTAPLTAITNTSLLLNGTDAGIIDKSQSVKTITLNGDVKSSTTQSKYLTSSMYFDGTGDSLTIGNNQGLHIGSGDFTIEMWFRAAAVNVSQTLMLRRAAVTARGFVININSSSANKLGFLAGDADNAGWEVSMASTSNLSADTWHHVAIVRSGNNFYLYLDGTQEATASSSVTIADDTSDLLIGTNEGGTGYFSGYISDFRITKGLARYTSNFTAPTAALQG